MFLQTEALSHRFADGTYGIREVTVGFEPAGLTVIAGRNGSGKTVLIRHLNGLLRPTSGSVCLSGRPVDSYGAAIGSRVGMVFQDAAAGIIGQSVAEDIAFGPENRGLSEPEIRERVEQSIRVLELEEYRHRDPHTLSGGEMRRLAIAGAYALLPQLLICDEPFTNLDYPGVVQVLSALLALKDRGCGIVVVTHEVEKILAHAERLMIMDAGRLVEDAAPGTLLPRLAIYGIRPSSSLGAMSWMP